jgi:hypothetical protein
VTPYDREFWVLFCPLHRRRLFLSRRHSGLLAWAKASDLLQSRAWIRNAWNSASIVRPSSCHEHRSKYDLRTWIYFALLFGAFQWFFRKIIVVEEGHVTAWRAQVLTARPSRFVFPSTLFLLLKSKPLVPMEEPESKKHDVRARSVRSPFKGKKLLPLRKGQGRAHAFPLHIVPPSVRFGQCTVPENKSPSRARSIPLVDEALIRLDMQWISQPFNHLCSRSSKAIISQSPNQLSINSIIYTATNPIHYSASHPICYWISHTTSHMSVQSPIRGLAVGLVLTFAKHEVWCSACSRQCVCTQFPAAFTKYLLEF